VLKWFRHRPKAGAVAVLGDIEIGEPWACPSSMMSSQAGGFLTIANKGPAPDRLVAAASPAARRIEIQGIKVVGGGIAIRPLDNGLVIHAGATLVLRPRGYHLLLTGLQAPPVPGARLPVTLAFERAGSIDIDLTVLSAGLVGVEILDEEHHRG